MLYSFYTFSNSDDNYCFQSILKQTKILLLLYEYRLKLTTYSGSKQTSLTYKHDPFKLVLKVPKTADKVSGSISFEKEYLW